VAKPGFGIASFPLGCSWFVLSGVVALLIFVLYMTFVPGLPFEPGFTLKHWANVASSRLITKVIPNTAIVGFGALFVATFFALPLAWLLNRTTLPFRNTFTTLMVVPVIIPGFILAIAWILLVDEHIGLFNRVIASLLGLETVPLSIMNNLFGMAWVMGVMLTPAIFFLISGPMRAVDPALEEVASIVGLTQWGILYRVTLPLVWPGLLGGLIYVFMTAVSIFELPALLGAASGKVPVLATEIFYAVRPAGAQTVTFAYGAAGVYGVLLAAPSLVALYFYLRMLARSERYQVITGRGDSGATVQLAWESSFGVGDEIPFEFTFLDENGNLIKEVLYGYRLEDSNGIKLVEYSGSDPTILGIPATEGIDLQNIRIPKEGVYTFTIALIGKGIVNTDFTYSGIESTIIEIGPPGEKTSSPKPPSDEFSIPDWVRNNAGWWADGKIDDNSFASGIEYMIKEGIIKVPITITGEVTGESVIPDWVRNNAGWWADGLISDEDFANGLQYLIKIGVISV